MQWFHITSSFSPGARLRPFAPISRQLWHGSSPRPQGKFAYHRKDYDRVRPRVQQAKNPPERFNDRVPLDIRSPPASLMAGFEFRQRRAKRVQQKKYTCPDQVDDGKTKPPQGWKRVEGCEESRDVLMQGEGKNNDESMDSEQMEEIEEQRYASKGNQVYGHNACSSLLPLEG